MIHLTLAVVTLFVLLSLSTATDTANVIRVPLERRYHPAHDPARNQVRNLNKAFLQSQMAHVKMKYAYTLAAYESNTGSPHPLAEAITTVGGAGTSWMAGKMEKRRKTRVPTTPSHLARGPYCKRDDISLSEANSNMWMGTIRVGTPPRQFTVDFDTGSSDLFLPNRSCDTNCDGHKRYDPTASSTSVDLGNTFTLTYMGGSTLNGTLYADNVYMSGYEAVNQTLGAATAYSAGLKNPIFRPDGLLGLGFPSLSAFRASPVFQTLISNHVIPQGVFGFALSSQPGKSELTIGGTNTSLYQQSTIEYVNVSLPAYWQVRFAGLSRPGLNGTPDVVIVNKTSYAEAIIDTGTTVIMTTDSLAQAYYANVPGAKPSTEIGGGLWTVPCDIIGSLAPTLTFGSRNFTVSPATFNLGPASEGSIDCVAGLAGGGSAWWLIGDVFLQNVYSIFDVDNNRVGFADLA